jgi:predicted transporter
VSLLRRKWKSEEADEWTREDTFTIVISPIIYVLLLIGVALSIFLVPAGFMMLGVGIVLLVVMVFVIEPKLSAISRGYEKQQKKYMEELERKVKWED